MAEDEFAAHDFISTEELLYTTSFTETIKTSIIQFEYEGSAT